MNLSESVIKTDGERAESQRRDVLQAVLEASREAVIVLDAGMRISTVNDAAIRAFAWQDGTLSGKRLTEVIRNPELHEAFQMAVRFESSSDIRLELADSVRHIFDVHVAPIEVDGERRAIGRFYDVTQIEHLEKVRQEFLSNISHELRTPLTAIMAFVETLEDGAIDDRENNRHFLSVIRRNAERMHALIADILELSLIESGNVSVDLKQANLSSAIDEIFSALSANAAGRRVQLRNGVPRGAHVFADAVRLEQMLTNLIDNAIKFNRENGTVTVSLDRRGDFDIISVSDTGEGISTEHLQRIFERFYRADRGRTREIGGTGLGLAIVKHLARLHGGEISVQSALGRGTTFFIELPARQPLTPA